MIDLSKIGYQVTYFRNFVQIILFSLWEIARFNDSQWSKFLYVCTFNLDILVYFVIMISQCASDPCFDKAKQKERSQIVESARTPLLRVSPVQKKALLSSLFEEISFYMTEWKVIFQPIWLAFVIFFIFSAKHALNNITSFGYFLILSYDFTSLTFSTLFILNVYVFGFLYCGTKWLSSPCFCCNINCNTILVFFLMFMMCVVWFSLFILGFSASFFGSFLGYFVTLIVLCVTKYCVSAKGNYPDTRLFGGFDVSEDEAFLAQFIFMGPANNADNADFHN